MKEYEDCQLLSQPTTPPREELDEESLELLLQRSYAVLTKVLERKLPKALHSDVAHLHREIGDVLSWVRLM